MGTKPKKPGSTSPAANDASQAPNKYNLFPRMVDEKAPGHGALSLALVTSTATSGLSVNKKVPAIAYIRDQKVYYAESKDVWGSGWRQPVQVSKLLTGLATECYLLDVGGAPAVAYVVHDTVDDKPNATVRFSRYYAFGQKWSSSVAAGDDFPALGADAEDNVAIRGLSAAMIDGQPAIAYFRSKDKPEDLTKWFKARYARAEDSEGSQWGDLEGQGPAVGGTFYQAYGVPPPATSLREFSQMPQDPFAQKKPLLAMHSGKDLLLAWSVGASSDGNPDWKYQTVIAGSQQAEGGAGGFLSLRTQLGSPRISYRTATGDLAFVAATGMDDGWYTWKQPYTFQEATVYDTELALAGGKFWIGCMLADPLRVCYTRSTDATGNQWQPMQVVAEIEGSSKLSVASIGNSIGIAYHDDGLRFVLCPS